MLWTLLRPLCLLRPLHRAIVMDARYRRLD